MWEKIIYTYLVHGTQMTKVTRDRVCLIFALMRDDINVNVGVVIFMAMRKARFSAGHGYGFGGLLIQVLSDLIVEEEDLYYRLGVDTHPVYISITKGVTGIHGPILTMPVCQDRNNEITAQVYGLHMLQLRIGGHPATQQKI